MTKVYISSPYSQGSTIFNVRLAIEAANTLLLEGFTPFVPHLNFAWDLIYPHSYHTWLDWCLDWVIACDCLLRIHGASPGADAEVALAEGIGMPVYYSVCELLEGERGEGEDE